MMHLETDWEHIWQLFFAAIELPAAEQQAWLQQHAADHERTLLHKLLASHQSSDSMLDQPLRLQRPLLHAGAVLDAWQIERLLARGGFGEVYLASRCDGAFVRDVAIKVYSPLIAGAGSRENFLRERQILAQLDHPGITRLLDAGYSDQGLLYLVMEYVAGVPLLQHCQQQQPDQAARLALFEQICTAVDYAHRQLIVHGDLHPGNIMVCAGDAGWQTKLLDFGISRLLTARQETAGHGFTPDYASPEQLLQLPTGTATDVFAAGVILTVLLTGKTPFVADLTDQAVYLQAVQQGPQPLAALSHADASDLALPATQLPPELDWIKDRCLHYQPEQRYTGMQALLEDLRRLREHYPVTARALTPAYRLRKYLRRQWRWVASYATVTLLLATLVVLLNQQQQLTTQALLSSEQQRQQAEVTVDFLARLFDLADRTRQGGAAADALTMLQRGRQQLQQDQAMSAQLKLPLVSQLSEIYRNLGDYDSAMQLARQSLTMATAQADRQAVISAQLAIGKIQFLAGELQASVATLEAALRQIGNIPSSPLASLQVQIMLALCTGWQHLGDLSQAGEHFQQAARRIADLATATPADELLLLQAEVLLRLGSWHWSSGHLLQARDYYLAALAAHEALDQRQLPELARAVDAYASAHLALGDYALAAEQFSRAVSLRRTALGEQHQLTADSISNLGAAYYELGDDQRAAAVLQEALDIYRALGFERHLVIGKALNNLGLVRLRQGAADTARALFAEALGIHQDTLGQQHVMVVGNLNNLGLAAELNNDLEQAVDYYQQALDMQQQMLGDSHPGLAVMHTNLARIEMFRQRFRAAEQLLQQALTILRQSHGDDNVNMAGTLFWSGILQCAQGKSEAALQTLQRAHELRLPLGAQHPDTVIARGGLARCRMRCADLSAAAMATEQRHWLALQLRFPRPHPWQVFIADLLVPH